LLLCIKYLAKERELATDPDCAAGLEQMAYSMDDFVSRVFMDSPQARSLRLPFFGSALILTLRTRQIRVAHQTPFCISRHPSFVGYGSRYYSLRGVLITVVRKKDSFEA